MGSRITPGFGLCLFEDLDDELAAQGAGALQSTYTQSGPGPGVPEPADATSRWRPYLRGAQSVDLTVRTLRPGYVRQGGGGAAVAYRLASDAGDEDWRGWCPPNLPLNWTSPSTQWLDTITYSMADSDMVSTPNGEVVALVGPASTASAKIVRYDPRTATWATGATFPQGLPRYRSLVYDPEISGRLLLFAANGAAGSASQIAYFSDDDGDTFEVYSIGSWNGTAAGGSLSVAVAAGIEWLAATTDTLWYSDTRGLTWTESEDISAHVQADSVQVFRIAGAWLVLYLTDTDSYPAARLLTSSRAVFGDADEVVLTATAAGKIRGTLDADGRIWVFTSGTGTGAPARDVWQSSDGRTWQSLRWRLQLSGSDSGGGAYRVCSAAGRSWLLTVTETTGGTIPTTGRLHLLELGGWSSIESGSGLNNSYRTGRDRMGWGTWTGGGTDAEGFAWYVPYDSPTDVGGDWTAVTNGTGGTLDMDFDAALLINTASTTANGLRYRRTASSSYLTGTGLAVVRAETGGPDLGTAGSPESKISILHRLADGVYDYAVEIRLGADGIRVADSTGGIARSLAALDGTEWTHIAWHLTKGQCWVWVRQGAETNWTVVSDGVVISDAGATANTDDSITWGNGTLGSSATGSYWRLVAANGGGAWHHGIDAVADLGDTPADRVLGLRFGKSLAQGTYPLPDATAPSEALGSIGAAGGPTYTGEIVELPTAYQRGLDQASPFTAPSPWSYWESTDASVDQEIVWDAGSGRGRYRGGALALVAVRCRIGTALFQVEDGAGGWTTLGTLDLRRSWDYLVDGDTLRPDGDAAGENGTRYYAEDELAGGWASVETSLGDVEYRPILGNTAGYISNAANRQQIRVRIGGVTGTEVSSSGRLVHHSGVLVVYPTTEYRRRALRVVVESLVNTIDDASDYTHRAGILYPARVVGIGIRPGWDWNRRLDPERTVDRAVDGTPRITRRGPSREVWSYGWQAGVHLQELRDYAIDPGYVAVSGGLPIGTAHDAGSLWQHVDRLMQSGQVPCVVLPQLPASSGAMVTDPTMYLYGHATAESYGLSGFAGTEGTDEAVRVDGLTVEGFGRQP